MVRWHKKIQSFQSLDFFIQVYINISIFAVIICVVLPFVRHKWIAIYRSKINRFEIIVEK